MFLSELGFNATDAQLSSAVEKILTLTDDDGIPLNVFNISPGYGGTGQNQSAWMLCDAPLMVYALTLLGLGDDDRVRSARKKLTGLCQWKRLALQRITGFRKISADPAERATPAPLPLY